MSDFLKIFREVQKQGRSGSLEQPISSDGNGGESPFDSVSAEYEDPEEKAIIESRMKNTGNSFLDMYSLMEKQKEVQGLRIKKSNAEGEKNLANRNEFMRGLYRGADTLQATYQGGLGMLSSLAGDEVGARERFRAYQDEMRQASENPRTEMDLFSTDAKTGAFGSLSNFGTYAAGTLGEAVPSLAESVLSGIAGAALGAAIIPAPDPGDVVTVPVGAVGGLIGKGAIKKAIASTAAQYAKQGVAADAAEQLAKQYVGREVAKRVGAVAANTAVTGLHEGGGMYAEGLQQGYDSPGTAAALGVASGLSESLLGAAPGVLKAFAGRSGVDEIARQKGVRAAAGYLWDIVKESGQEGVQEGFQEFLGSVNQEINDPNFNLFTKENFMRWAEAAGAGAVVGGAVRGGVVGTQLATGRGRSEGQRDFEPRIPSPPPESDQNELIFKIQAERKLLERLVGEVASDPEKTISRTVAKQFGLIAEGEKTNPSIRMQRALGKIEMLKQEEDRLSGIPSQQSPPPPGSVEEQAVVPPDVSKSDRQFAEQMAGGVNVDEFGEIIPPSRVPAPPVADQGEQQAATGSVAPDITSAAPETTNPFEETSVLDPNAQQPPVSQPEGMPPSTDPFDVPLRQAPQEAQVQQPQVETAMSGYNVQPTEAEVANPFEVVAATPLPAKKISYRKQQAPPPQSSDPFPVQNPIEPTPVDAVSVPTPSSQPEVSEKLKEAIRTWKGSPSNLKRYLKVFLEGGNVEGGNVKEGVELARAFVDGVAERSKAAPTLYRGDNKDPSKNDSPYLGWTSNKKQAEKWAKEYGGTVYTKEGAVGLEVKSLGLFDADESEWIVPNRSQKISESPDAVSGDRQREEVQDARGTKKGGGPNVQVQTEGGQRPSEGQISPMEEQAADEAPSPVSSLQVRDSFTDSQGQRWLVHSSRNGVVLAHPVVDGKAQVNKDSGVPFAISEQGRIRNPEYRTDIQSVEKWTEEADSKPVAQQSVTPTVSREQVENHFVKKQTDLGASEQTARQTAKKTYGRIWDKIRKSPWKTMNSLQVKGRGGVSLGRMVRDKVTEMKKAGFLTVAWDRDGNPHYALPGTQTPEWLTETDTDEARSKLPVKPTEQSAASPADVSEAPAKKKKKPAVKAKQEAKESPAKTYLSSLSEEDLQDLADAVGVKATKDARIDELLAIPQVASYLKKVVSEKKLSKKKRRAAPRDTGERNIGIPKDLQTPQVVEVPSKDFTEDERKQERILKKLGVTLRLTESGNQDLPGMFIGDSRTIWYDRDYLKKWDENWKEEGRPEKAMTWGLFAHEMFHAIKQSSPKAWRSLYNWVRKNDPEGLGKARVAYLADQMRIGNEEYVQKLLSDEDLRNDEGLSRYLEDRAAYFKFWNELGKARPGLLAKIGRWVRRVLRFAEPGVTNPDTLAGQARLAIERAMKRHNVAMTREGVVRAAVGKDRGVENERKARTLDEVRSRVAKDYSLTVSSEPMRMIDGKSFSSLDPDAVGAGLLVRDADSEMQRMMRESLQEAGVPDEIASTVKVPSSADVDYAFRLTDGSRYWYELSAIGFVKDFFNLSRKLTERLIDIVAGTSGGQKPTDNLRVAVASMAQDMQGRPVSVGTRDESSLTAALSPAKLETHKFGNFSDTMQVLGGLRPGVKPLPTIDLQMAAVFGVQHAAIASDSRMYEAMSRFLIKLRDAQNAMLKNGEQPYESWQIQALLWVAQRDTSDPDSFNIGMPKIVAQLNKAGIPTPGGKITEETLMDPRTSDVLAPTSKIIPEAYTATIETRTKLTKVGKESAEVFDELKAIDAPWARNLVKEFEKIQRRTMRAIGNRRPPKPGNKTRQKSVASMLLSVIMDKSTGSHELSRVDTDAWGTFEGNASPNIRFPLNLGAVGDTEEGGGTKRYVPTKDHREQFLSVLGKYFNQKSQAASQFIPADLGSHDTFSILVRRYDKVGITEAELAEISEGLGRPISYKQVPNGWQLDINIGGFDKTEEQKAENRDVQRIHAVMQKFASKGAIFYQDLPRSYDSSYIEKSDYNKHIRRLEDEIRRNADTGGSGEAVGDTPERRASDYAAIVELIKGIAAEQESAFRKWTKNARELAAKRNVQLGNQRGADSGQRYSPGRKQDPNASRRRVDGRVLGGNLRARSGRNDGRVGLDYSQERFNKEHGLDSSIPSLVAVYENPAGPVLELNPRYTAEIYHKTLDKLRSSHPAGIQVSLKDVDEYRGFRLFMAEDGTAVAALNGQDMVSLASGKNASGTSMGSKILHTLIEQGGRTGDAYGSFLPNLYAKFGFQPVARLGWSDDIWKEYADAEVAAGRFTAESVDPGVLFKAWGGKVDYYFVAYTGDTTPFDTLDKALVEKVPLVEDWDAGLEAQQKALRDVAQKKAKENRDESKKVSKRSGTRFGVGRKTEVEGRRGEAGYDTQYQTPLADAPRKQGATGPDPKVVQAAERYAKSVGIELKRQAKYVAVDEKFAKRIAKAYEEMANDPFDPKVVEAFRELYVQTTAQYQALVDEGFSFYFYDGKNDPYADKEGGFSNPYNAIRELRTKQRMAVFPTSLGFGDKLKSDDYDVKKTPSLASTGIMWPWGSPDGPLRPVLANDMFRAVHDTFGHSMEGAGFRARGEENAWQAHVRLFYGAAVGAMTSSTRGQNSWLNFGPYGETNQTAKVEDTVFAEQKIGLMPEWTWTEGRAADMEETGDEDVRYSPARQGRRKRDPDVTKAAQDLKAGLIDRNQYQRIVDMRMPLRKFDEVPIPASREDMLRGLGDRKAGERLKRDLIQNPEDIAKGMLLESRLDIPAYDEENVWVVSLHEPRPNLNKGSASRVVAYSPTSVLKNVTFGVTETAAMNIAAGKPKSTIATMRGEYVPMTAQQAYKLAEANKDRWVEIGMNPIRHTYFYDKDTQTPVVSAEEVVQVGGMVLAKNPVMGLRDDYRYSPGRQLDAEYLSAVDRGDMRTAQLMVDKAAAAAGEFAGGVSPVLYHGSPHSEFYEFMIPSKGFNSTVFGSYEVSRNAAFFTTDEEAASRYREQGGRKGGSVRKFRVFGELLDWRDGISDAQFNRLVSEGVNSRWLDRKGASWELFDKEEDPDGTLVKAIQKMGYDGVIIKDTDGTSDFDAYVAFTPSQIKSSDAATYDDDGNVVPLSERFDYARSDIRYSPGRKKKDDILAGLYKHLEKEGVINPQVAGERTTSIKNRKTDELRAESGLPPRVRPSKESFGMWEEEARRRYPTAIDRLQLVAEIEKDPERLGKIESAAIGQHIAYLDNQRRDGKDVFDELRRTIKAANIGGTEAGRALVSRKAERYSDFSLAGLVDDHISFVGRDPTDEQMKEYAKLADRIKKLEADKIELAKKLAKETIARKKAEAGSQPKPPQKNRGTKQSALLKKVADGFAAFRDALGGGATSRPAVGRQEPTEGIYGFGFGSEDLPNPSSVSRDEWLRAYMPLIMRGLPESKISDKDMEVLGSAFGDENPFSPNSNLMKMLGTWATQGDLQDINWSEGVRVLFEDRAKSTGMMLEQIAKESGVDFNRDAFSDPADYKSLAKAFAKYLPKYVANNPDSGSDVKNLLETSKALLDPLEYAINVWEDSQQAETSVASTTDARFSAGKQDVDIKSAAASLVATLREAGVSSMLELESQVNANMPNITPEQMQVIKDAWEESNKKSKVTSPIGSDPEASDIAARAKELMRSAIDLGYGAEEENWMEVVDVVHDQLSLEVPGISKYDTMQAMSDYGVWRPLNTEEIAVKTRAIRGKVRQSLKIEDILKAIEQSRQWLAGGMRPQEVARRLRDEGRLPKATGQEQATPDSIERDLISEFNKLKKKLPVPAESTEGQLKSALSTAKTAASNRLELLNNEIKALQEAVDNRTELVKPVAEKVKLEPDEELANLRSRLEEKRRQRDELKDRYEAIFPSAKKQVKRKPLTDAQKLESSVKMLQRQINSLVNELKDLQSGVLPPAKVRSEVTSDRKEELKAELAALREARRQAREANPVYQAMEEAKYWEQYRKSQEKRLVFWQNRRDEARAGRLPVPLKKRTITDKAIIEKNMEIEEAQYEAMIAIEKAKRETWNAGQWIGQGILEATSLIPRTLMLGMEMSFVLRQGFFYTYSQPMKSLGALVEAIPAVFSQRMAIASMEDIESRPNAKEYDLAKVEFTRSTGPQAKLEELYQSAILRWLEGTETKLLLPLRTWAKVYAMFERGNRTFSNIMKADLYDIQKRDTLAAREFFGLSTDWTENDIKQAGRTSNIFSGRGTGLRSGNPWLDWLFLARRWTWSRIQADFIVPFQLVTPQWIGQWNADRGMRVAMAKLYIQAMVGHAAKMAAAYFVYSLLAGDDEEEKPTIEWDLRSSDALAMKIGETRFKDEGGLMPAVVLAARILSGTIKTGKGEIKSIYGEGVEYGGQTAADFLINYGRYKLGTAPSAILEWISGRDAVGNVVSKTDIVTSRMVPLTWKEIASAESELGLARGTLSAIEAFFGVSVSTHGSRTKYKKASASERDKLFERDLKSMEWNTPDFAYKDLLTEEQAKQMFDQREAKKQAVVYAALANPKRQTYRSDESYQKSIEERNKALAQFKEMGVDFMEARRMLLDYYKRNYGSAYEMKANGYVAKEGFSARLRQLRGMQDAE